MVSHELLFLYNCVDFPGGLVVHSALGHGNHGVCLAVWCENGHYQVCLYFRYLKTTDNKQAPLFSSSVVVCCSSPNWSRGTKSLPGSMSCTVCRDDGAAHVSNQNQECEGGECCCSLFRACERQTWFPTLPIMLFKVFISVLLMSAENYPGKKQLRQNEICFLKCYCVNPSDKTDFHKASLQMENKYCWTGWISFLYDFIYLFILPLSASLLSILKRVSVSFRKGYRLGKESALLVI